MKKTLLAFLSVCLSVYVSAQDSLEANGEATGMRSNEKIYVVMAVVCTILAGLFVYVIRLDRKISKLEKSQ